MNNANLWEFCSNYWLGCILVWREELLQERSLEYPDAGRKKKLKQTKLAAQGWKNINCWYFELMNTYINYKIL